MTKALFILILSVLNSIIGQAQTNVYHPFPNSSCQWTGLNWDHSGGGSGPVQYDSYQLSISGDTTIGSFIYHKLYQSGFTYCQPCPIYNGQNYNLHYVGAFRQDTLNKKVYLYKNGTDNLAYDFNLNVGDTIKTCLSTFQTGHYISSIDSVIVSNKYHKRFWIDGCNYALIEGIGSMFGAFNDIFCPFEMGNDLHCVRIGTTTAWALSSQYNCDLGASIPEKLIKTNNIVISQNPFWSETTLTFNARFDKANLSVYNSSGQLVKQIKHISGQSYILNRDNLESGMYFLRVSESNDVIATGKLVIIDN